MKAYTRGMIAIAVVSLMVGVVQASQDQAASGERGQRIVVYGTTDDDPFTETLIVDGIVAGTFENLPVDEPVHARVLGSNADRVTLRTIDPGITFHARTASDRTSLLEGETVRITRRNEDEPATAGAPEASEPEADRGEEIGAPEPDASVETPSDAQSDDTPAIVESGANDDSADSAPSDRADDSAQSDSAQADDSPQADDSAQASDSPALDDEAASAEETLPKTASPIGLIALIGLVGAGSAAGVRFARRK